MANTGREGGPALVADIDVAEASRYLARGIVELAASMVGPGVESSMVTRRGILASAGTLVERALKCACAREGTPVPARRDAQSDGLEDLRVRLKHKGALPVHVDNHVRTVQNWRNMGTHDKGDIRDVSPATLETVVISAREVVQWVLGEYLGGDAWIGVLDAPVAKLVDERQHLVFQVVVECTLGRSRECGIPLPHDTKLSRTHCRIVWTGNAYVIEDLGSTNGTFVDGERIFGQRALRGGEEVWIGDSRFRFAWYADEPRAPPGRAGGVTELKGTSTQR